jgi:hypothetical protein
VTPRQLNLFTQTNLATVMRDIKIAMNEAIKDSGKSRDQVLDMMNGLATRYGMRLNGRAGLSKDSFEKWLNVEEENRLPSMKGITVFCAVLHQAQMMNCRITSDANYKQNRCHIFV